jgi:thiamine pyrophosphokinase
MKAFIYIGGAIHPDTITAHPAGDDLVIAADSGYENALALGEKPSILVGDLDSLSPELKERFSDRIVHIAEQESNDLSKSFAFCLSKDASPALRQIKACFLHFALCLSRHYAFRG